MSTADSPTKVLVPVDKIDEWAGWFDAAGMGLFARKMRETIEIPKPRPRIVAVTRKHWIGGYGTEWFDAQPNLLDLFDDVIEESSVHPFLQTALKAAFRDRLGVPIE